MVLASTLLCTALAFPGGQSLDASPLIGFVEFEAASHRDAGRTSALFLRIAFGWRVNKWQALFKDPHDLAELGAAWEAQPRPSAWKVCFKGRTAATIEAMRMDRWTEFSQVGRQGIVERKEEKDLADAERTESKTWMGTARTPDVATTGSCSDPDAWRPEAISGWIDIEAIKRAFLARALKTDPAATSASKKIRVRQFVTTSKGSDAVISLQLPEDEAHGDIVPEWFGQTYLARRGMPIKFIGANLVFLGAADFAGDGASRLVFARTRYDQDGYILVSKSGDVLAEFSWSYH